MTTSLPTSFSTAASVNFGTCWGTPQGQDLSMPSYMAKGNQVVAEALLRRWTTSQGQLVDDPSYGQNIYDLVNDDLSPRDLVYAQQRFAAEAQKDPRVLTSVVVLTLGATGLLTMNASITTAQGPFSLVLAVSAVTPLTLLVQP
jgi:hypothetical protein